MSTFSADIELWIRKTEIKGATVLKKLAFDAYAGILMRSPVKTGRFRASHRIGINRANLTVHPPVYEVGKVVTPPHGASPDGGEMGYASTSLAAVKWGDTIHITNNLHYARALENGYSRQTGGIPDGIYGATFAELVAKVQAAVAKATGP